MVNTIKAWSRNRYKGVEINQEKKIKLKKPSLKGLHLYKFSIALDGETVDFDVREVPDHQGLEEDLLTRDFTVNSIYFYRKNKENFILCQERVFFNDAFFNIFPSKIFKTRKKVFSSKN